MVFFLIIVLILGTDIPVCFDKNWQFLGVKVLCRKGVLIPLVCSVLLLYVLVFRAWLCHEKKGTRLGPVRITSIEHVDSEIMAFVASYFFPLVSFNYNTTWRHLVVLLGLFVLIGFIYIKANIYYCNPTLSILGYHVFRVTGFVSNTLECNVIVITKNNLQKGDSIKYIPIDNNTFFGYKI